MMLINPIDIPIFFARSIARGWEYLFNICTSLWPVMLANSMMFETFSTIRLTMYCIIINWRWDTRWLRNSLPRWQVW